MTAVRAARHRIVVAALCAAASSSACAAHAQPSVPPVAPPIFAGEPSARLFRGDRSGSADAMRLVVRDAESWRRAWATLAMGRADSATPPPVDFRAEIVIVAALGTRVAAGHRIAIDTVRRADFVLEAVVRSMAPAAGCTTAFSPVAPADAVRVPRSERPVLFVERSGTTPCAATTR